MFDVIRYLRNAKQIPTSFKHKLYQAEIKERTKHRKIYIHLTNTPSLGNLLPEIRPMYLNGDI